MNLYYSTSLSELIQLIGQPENDNYSFHLLVDHDGEVLIERNWKQNKALLHRYKFHIRGLRSKAYMGISAPKNLKALNQLYKNLLFCWERNVTGAIKNDKITFIQNINYWLEINNIVHPVEIANIISSFLKKEPRLSHHSIG